MSALDRRDVVVENDCEMGPKKGVSEALKLSEIGFSYGGDAPHLDVHVGFETGCVTGIIGPNGSGKSTALKVASGLLKPQKGSVVVGGKNLSEMGSKARARLLSYMPQTPVLSDSTVENFVLCGRYAHTKRFHSPGSLDYEIAHTSMRLAGVENLKNQSLKELSGGQRQRAHIALMLAQEADIMLLDEPLSALDISACHEMMNLVSDVAHGHEKAVVVVVHDLDLALRYCDRILVMNEGKMVFDGAPSEVVQSGILRQVFKVETHPVETEFGVGYAFFTDVKTSRN